MFFFIPIIFNYIIITIIINDKELLHILKILHVFYFCINMFKIIICSELLSSKRHNPILLHSLLIILYTLHNFVCELGGLMPLLSTNWSALNQNSMSIVYHVYISYILIMYIMYLLFGRSYVLVIKEKTELLYYVEVKTKCRLSLFFILCKLSSSFL